MKPEIKYILSADERERRIKMKYYLTEEEAKDASDPMRTVAALAARAKKRRAKNRPMKPVGSGRLVRSPGAQMIAAERARQMREEKWTPEHDDEHRGMELSRAAICYAHRDATARPCYCYTSREMSTVCPLHAGATWAPRGWPWSQHWWKPSTDPVRNLVKAGALIAAEIDRLTREAAQARRPNTSGLPGRASDLGSDRGLGASSATTEKPPQAKS